MKEGAVKRLVCICAVNRHPINLLIFCLGGGTAKVAYRAGNDGYLMTLSNQKTGEFKVTGTASLIDGRKSLVNQ